MDVERWREATRRDLHRAIYLALAAQDIAAHERGRASVRPLRHGFAPWEHALVDAAINEGESCGSENERANDQGLTPTAYADYEKINRDALATYDTCQPQTLARGYCEHGAPIVTVGRKCVTCYQRLPSALR